MQKVKIIAFFVKLNNRKGFILLQHKIDSKRKMRKTLKMILVSAICLFVPTSCCANNKINANTENKTKTSKTTVMAKDGKAIVVFFSHDGDNYAVGNIEVGNTKIVADYITELIGAEQFEIVTHKYDGMAYTPLIELAKEETRKGELPAYGAMLI